MARDEVRPPCLEGILIQGKCLLVHYRIHPSTPLPQMETSGGAYKHG